MKQPSVQTDGGHACDARRQPGIGCSDPGLLQYNSAKPQVAVGLISTSAVGVEGTMAAVQADWD